MLHPTPGNTTPETGTAPMASGNWPDGLRSGTQLPDPFPWPILVRWLLPGVFGAILLGAIALYFNARAQHQIIYLTRAGNLGVVYADGDGERELEYNGLRGRYQGIPQWSPHGDRFSIATSGSGDAAVLIAAPQRTQPDRISVGNVSEVVLPGQAWSASGAYLAAVKREAPDRASLALIDAQRLATVPVTLTVDPQVRPAWHPISDTLLVTSQTDGVTPTLQIVDKDGRVNPFAPQDGQVGRSAASWSPDGTTIAYVGRANMSDQTSSIWLVQPDGNQPRAVVQEGVNNTPIWSPNGDLLFFTRLITETQQYELHRLDLKTMQASLVGNTISRLGDLETDPRSVLDWSPDRRELFFQSAPSPEASVSVHVGRYDGSNAHPVYTEADSTSTTVRWSPTGRALLISDSSDGMLLQWLHEERTPTRFPNGLFPTWQP